MESNKRSVIMRDIVLKYIDGCTNYLKTFMIFLSLTLSGKTRFYTFWLHFHFFVANSCLYVSSWLPNICRMEYSNANVKKVETMLLKELKHSL